MATQTPNEGLLGNWYRNRIGEPATENEVRGYWMFVLGIVLAFVGVLLVFTSDSSASMRRWAIALAAAGLISMIAGPVIRLPLRRVGTWLAALGVTISALAIVWFITAYPAQWTPEAGQFMIIGLYAVGVLLVAASAVVVPRRTDKVDLENQVLALETEIAELEETAEASEAETEDLEEHVWTLQNEIAELEESVEASEADNDELAETIAGLQSKLSEAEGEEADNHSEVEQLRTDLADTESDHADLAAVLRDIRESESQFELYEDRGEEWRWRLRHQSGDVIATSNAGYDRQNVAQGTMQAVRRDAHGATVLVSESEEDLPEEGETENLVFAEDVESKATFELYEGEGEGEDHRWRLLHDNGNIIATAGQGYASHEGAKHSIEEFREYVGPADYLQPDPTSIEVYRDEGDEWRWRLRHRNGNILAGSGEGYASRSDVRAVIDHLRERSTAMDIEVYEDEAGGYRWRLAGEDDDKIILDSGGYESREGARDAVERVRDFLPEADIIDIGEAAFEVYEDEGGDHRWRLRHRNDNILATGAQGYAVRTGVWDGIESVKLNAPNADLEEPEA